MAITLNGTTGITTPDITSEAGLTVDGVSFASGAPANTLVTTSGGNVGVGTSSPTAKLTVNDANGVPIRIGDISAAPVSQTAAYVGASTSGLSGGNGDLVLIPRTSDARSILFYTGNGTAAERARIDSSGRTFVNCTSVPYSGTHGYINVNSTLGSGTYTITSIVNSTASQGHINFVNNNGNVGSINTSGTSTSYVTSSDYRLKHDIQPMTGALAKVQQLKPVTYKWNADNSQDEGFIAHELQEVCPSAVTGEKDGVETYTDEDGVEQTRPRYQGIDTSFLVATLTAAIQEQQAIITAQQAALESLTARVVALEGQP